MVLIFTHQSSGQNTHTCTHQSRVPGRVSQVWVCALLDQRSDPLQVPIQRGGPETCSGFTDRSVKPELTSSGGLKKRAVRHKPRSKSISSSVWWTLGEDTGWEQHAHWCPSAAIVFAKRTRLDPELKLDVNRRETETLTVERLRR